MALGPSRLTQAEHHPGSAREKLDSRLQAIFGRQTSAWRVKAPLVETGTERNTTVAFPLPLDIFAAMGRNAGSGGAGRV